MVAETGRRQKEHGDKILTRSTLQKIYYRWKKTAKKLEKEQIVQR